MSAKPDSTANRIRSRLVCQPRGLHRGVAACALALVFSSTWSSEVYKWVDENGRVHFGDRPPEAMQQDAEQVEVDPQVVDMEAARRAFSPRRGLPEDAAAEQARRDAARDEGCRELAQLLRAVSGRVLFVDEDGNEVQTSERERQAEQARLTALFDEHCRD